MQSFKKVTGLIFVLVFMLGYVAAAGAGANTYRIIDHAALKAKIEADQRNFLLVDARMITTDCCQLINTARLYFTAMV